MAPKSLSPAAKQALILNYFHENNAVLSSKDLDTVLTKVANTKPEQLKELLTNLIDDGQVRVEKIGSGNWYWSFVSEVKKSKERILHDLEADERKLNAAVVEMESRIEEESAVRGDDDGMILDGCMDRETLMEHYETLLNQTATMEKELASYCDSDPTDLLRKADEARRLKESAEKWTDYIESAESLFKKLTNNDRRAVADLMANACGDEYIVDEGLKDL